MKTFSEYEKRYNKYLNKMEKNLDTQRMIVRQSSLKFVLDYYKSIGHNPNLIETLRLSEIVSDYVFDGITPSIKTVVKNFDEVMKKHKE